VVVRLAGSAQALFRALYARGKPVQYAHVSAPLPLHHVQTAFAGPPMAAEIPSAGRPVTFGLLSALRRRGVAVARLSHAAGLSSTGSAAADRFLPLPERYVIPEATAAAVVAARERGGRVVAVGTTVARALEAAWRAGGRSARGEIAAGEGTAVLVMDEGTERGIVDAILTGVHEPGTSHYRLLRAFTGAALLDQSLELAEREGFLVHEFGDSVLVVARERARARAAA
jgi:S-adenosylmethionine:tRNA ribosyltransferase-isomerase